MNKSPSNETTPHLVSKIWPIRKAILYVIAPILFFANVSVQRFPPLDGYKERASALARPVIHQMHPKPFIKGQIELFIQKVHRFHLTLNLT